MDSRYILSRVYLHNPPPALPAHGRDPERKKSRSEEEEEEPEANPWVLIVVLLLAIGIMAATTEWVRVLRLWKSD